MSRSRWFFLLITRGALLAGMFLPGCGEGSPVPADSLGPLAVPEVVLDPFARRSGFVIREQNDEVPIQLVTLQPSAALTVNGGARRSVLAVPPSAIAFSCTPEEGWILTFAAGMDEKAAEDGTDGMTFAVRVDGEVRWETTIEEPKPGTKQEWHTGEIDLSARAGKSVEITLETGAGAHGVVRGDRGGWSRLRIVRRRDVPRRTGGDPSRPNVLLLLVDTLRADALGCYGSPRPTSPAVDRLARDGLVFENAYAACSWTAPSVASLFTGLLPSSHGVVSDSRSYLVDGMETLAETLAASGITTGGFVANPLITHGRNFDQGFETFTHHPLAPARELHDDFLSWWREHRGTQWFGYVHAMEPHDPYRPPEDWVRRFDPDYDGPFDGQAEAINTARGQIFRGPGKDEEPLPVTRRDARHLRVLYDGEVALWDRELDALLRTLSAEGGLENTVIIVTADHGEEFLEHGSLKHGHSLYEELVRVPLVLWGPGVVPADRVSRPVPMILLHRTICDLLGVKAGERALGPSLLEVREGVDPGPILFETESGQRKGRRGRFGIRGILREGWKLLVVPSQRRGELYELAFDPAEQLDVFRIAPGVRQKRHGRRGAREMLHPEARKLLRQLVRRLRRARRQQPWNTAPLDQETQRALQSLGYLR